MKEACTARSLEMVHGFRVTNRRVHGTPPLLVAASSRCAGTMERRGLSRGNQVPDTTDASTPAPDRPAALPGPDVGPDERHQRRTEPEDEWDEQVLETCARPEARDGVGSGARRDQRGGYR